MLPWAGQKTRGMRAFSLDNPSLSLVLRPNCSLTSAQAALFMAGLSLPPLIVGVGFFTIGVWPVLPFAGLEIVLIALCFKLVRRSVQSSELLFVDEDYVKLRQLSPHHERQYCFLRYWTQVRLVTGISRFHPSKLMIGSHGKYVQIGQFLTESARQELTKQLKIAVKARYHCALT